MKKNNYSSFTSTLTTLTKIEHTPAYIRALKYLSSSINNNKRNDEKVKNVIKYLKNNKLAFLIEFVILRILYLLLEFNNKSLNFIKGI